MVFKTNQVADLLYVSTVFAFTVGILSEILFACLLNYLCFDVSRLSASQFVRLF